MLFGLIFKLKFSSWNHVSTGTDAYKGKIAYTWISQDMGGGVVSGGADLRWINQNPHHLLKSIPKKSTLYLIQISLINPP